jgi:hypothetical protein
MLSMLLFLQIPLPPGLNTLANILKGFSIAIGVAIAVGFVWLWWVHRMRERDHELLARARAVYTGFLRFSLDHAPLADPMLGGLTTPSEISRYKSYVASLLSAAEEILHLQPKPEWRSTLLRHLMPHRSFLSSDEFRATILDDCSAEVRSLVEHAVRG